MSTRQTSSLLFYLLFVFLCSPFLVSSLYLYQDRLGLIQTIEQQQSEIVELEQRISELQSRE